MIEAIALFVFFLVIALQNFGVVFKYSDLVLVIAAAICAFFALLRVL